LIRAAELHFAEVQREVAELGDLIDFLDLPFCHTHVQCGRKNYHWR
jgi:predicted DNA-binding protein with PD1-like motif